MLVAYLLYRRQLKHDRKLAAAEWELARAERRTVIASGVASEFEQAWAHIQQIFNDPANIDVAW